VKGLLAADYLSGRSELLRGDKALASVDAGSPAWDHAFRQADDEALELPSTTHIAIVDAAGNALSMTSTIEDAFGSRLMAGGYLLNNELTDFSFRTQKDGVPIANRVEPGKRPRSSMSPTIVLEKGRPVLVIGSPGGSRIIGYVVKTLIARLDWGMSIEAAIALPNLVNRTGAFEFEGGTPAGDLAGGPRRSATRSRRRSSIPGCTASRSRRTGSRPARTGGARASAWASDDVSAVERDPAS
jgi:gamma-glutamyltranspeptidase/glutathione hydrolase